MVGRFACALACLAGRFRRVLCSVLGPGVGDLVVMFLILSLPGLAIWVVLLGIEYLP